MTAILLALLLDWSATATAQARARLDSEWTAVLAAEKTFGRWRVEYRQRAYDGDWVIRIGGWTYFVRRGELICRQQGTDFITCANGDFVELRAARIARHAAATQPVLTLAVARALHRAIFGTTLAIDERGRAVIETVVSTPAAAERTSRRYRVRARVTASGYELEAPQLVEEYAETCAAIHGCHSTHWTCRRR